MKPAFEMLFFRPGIGKEKKVVIHSPPRIHNQAPKIDQIGPKPVSVAHIDLWFFPGNAMQRVIDAQHQMVGVELCQSLRTDTGTTAGIENNRRSTASIELVGLSECLESRFGDGFSE
jgi:hypothetical protein